MVKLVLLSPPACTKDGPHDQLQQVACHRLRSRHRSLLTHKRLLGALIFLAYPPFTDTRFRETARELHARHGIKNTRGETVVEVDVEAR